LDEKRRGGLHIKANLIAGILTLIPILVVWLVLDFILAVLFRVGAPLERALVEAITRVLPAVEPVLTNDYFEWFIAVAVALLLIYSIGAAASHVVGDRLLGYFEGLIDRIPGVKMVYSASKKLIVALQHPPGSAARIVLIDFPFKGMKVVGLVMRTMRDANSGEEIAFVYVPTTPNPTSGYLEIVPVKDLVSTDMTMDQAMALIISGGTIAPEQFTMTAKPEGDDPDAEATPALAAGVAPIVPDN
jgi:uncharacterized membrane protein